MYTLLLNDDNTTWAFKQRTSPSDESSADQLIHAENVYPLYDGQPNSASLAGEGGTKETWIPTLTHPSEVHVELLKRGWIPDPYKGFEEHNVQWIGEVEWLYRCTFTLQTKDIGEGDKIELEFQGLDTLCDVYLNDTKLIHTSNQFRTWIVTVPRDLLRLVSSPTSVVSKNVLLLHFHSAKQFALKEEEKYGAVRAGSTNLGHPSRVYLRKAQYDWRWDWGPELMTCGPYRPILLRSYNLRIKDVFPRASLLPNLNINPKEKSPDFTPYMNAQVTLSGLCPSQGHHQLQVPEGTKLHLDLVDKSTGETVVEQSLSLDASESTATASQDTNSLSVLPKLKGEDGASVDEGPDEDLAQIEFGEAWTQQPSDTVRQGIKSWWPVGYGSQQLYQVKVQLLAKDGTVLDEMTKTTGFRHVKLVQEPLEEADYHGKGTSFLFEVNGVRMFIGGSNWIPADNFLTTISEQRYRAWLELLKDGNQNMVRIWGGGIYEPDVFYEICDELGILVWQDFQFACGVYPAHPSFLSTVRAEARSNITRLRSHPCMALWCGNNEDYQMVLQWGDVADFPAIKIYEEILPELVSELTSIKTKAKAKVKDEARIGMGTAAGTAAGEGEGEGEVPYWRGSPYGGKGWDTADPTIGDVHQWNVWGGKEYAYQDYDILGGRFVSEFGMPAMPQWKTIKYWMDGAPEEEWYHQSPLIAQHCKAGVFERRFGIPLGENFRVTEDLETYVYNTQLMQAEAVGYAYRVWRRQWRGRGKEYTSGVIVWQLNDCWPVTSWAIVDYFLRPKPCYYVIARELAPVTVGTQRTVHHNRKSDRPRAFYEYGATQSHSATLDIWGTNSTLQPITVSVHITAHDLKSPSWSFSQTIPSLTLLPNQSTEILSAAACPCPSLEEVEYNVPVKTWTTSGSVVVCVIVRDLETGRVLARASDWPQPYRYLDVKTYAREAGLSVKVGKDGESVRVDCVRPVKGLVLGVQESGSIGEGDADGTRDGDEVKWSDNALDLIPGDVQVVKARGLKGRGVTVRYLGKEKV